MGMELDGKHILITGRARVGQFVARELLGAGARVSMTYLKDESEVLEGTRGYLADFTNENSIHGLFASVSGAAGRLDGLVNMVSMFTADEEVLTLATIEKTFMVNAFGNMLAAR